MAGLPPSEPPPPPGPEPVGQPKSPGQPVDKPKGPGEHEKGLLGRLRRGGGARAKLRDIAQGAGNAVGDVFETDASQARISAKERTAEASGLVTRIRSAGAQYFDVHELQVLLRSDLRGLTEEDIARSLQFEPERFIEYKRKQLERGPDNQLAEAIGVTFEEVDGWAGEAATHSLNEFETNARLAGSTALDQDPQAQAIRDEEIIRLAGHWLYPVSFHFGSVVRQLNCRWGVNGAPTLERMRELRKPVIEAWMRNPLEGKMGVRFMDVLTVGNEIDFDSALGEFGLDIPGFLELEKKATSDRQPE